MYGRPQSRPQWSRWPDLPPDLLREISGHLPHVNDFVRFHAVCKAWRSSHDPATTQIFMPWLLARTRNMADPLYLRCIFSKKSYLAPPPSSDRWTNWVCGADDGALRYFTALPSPVLHDPLVAGSGDHTVLSDSFPCQIPWLVNYPNGIVYRDGTILLYNWYHLEDGDKAEFKAAVLRPDDTTWMVVERTLESSDYGDLYVGYHGGKILVAEESSTTTTWHVVTVGNNDDTPDVLVPTPSKQGRRNELDHCYVLESQGELLLVSVNFHTDYPERRNLLDCLSVSVHVLQEASVPEKLRWVRKHGQSLANRVFFLGRPNSFVVDASRLDNDGGCTYFVCHDYYGARYCVIRYNFVNGKAGILETLPRTWEDENCAWLILQPTMAPVQEIRKRLIEAPRWKCVQKVAQVTPTSNIYSISLPLQPCFRILVCNLPPTVNSSQLRYYFSKHGEVSSAEVICYKKTQTSQGKGFITMATTHVHPEDAVATLRGLVWNGYSLKVSLVNKVAAQRWRPSPRRATQQHIPRSSRS